MKDTEGFVLNGGTSSRMGTSKGSLRIGGVTFAEHAANALLAVCHSVYLVGGDATIDGVETVPDVPLKGIIEKASIYGLRSALLHCSTKYAAVLACDMPFVTGEVLERLVAEVGVLDSDRADIIIPLDKSARLQPLCAIYERDRSHAAIDAFLETGDLQILSFVDTLRVRVIETAKFADLENADCLFTNINTPEDMNHADRNPSELSVG